MFIKLLGWKTFFFLFKCHFFRSARPLCRSIKMCYVSEHSVVWFLFLLFQLQFESMASRYGLFFAFSFSIPIRKKDCLQRKKYHCLFALKTPA